MDFEKAKTGKSTFKKGKTNEFANNSKSVTRLSLPVTIACLVFLLPKNKSKSQK